MSRHRLVTVTVMHGLDLSRRRLALAILVALPLAFYFSGRMQVQELGATADDQLWVLASGAMGTSWAVAVAALFVVNGSRRADQPLLLAGYRPAELLLGRVVTVLVLAAVITPAFALLIGSQQEVDVAVLALAIGVGCVASVAIGVVAAALVPRDMEGVLLVIGVVGIQMTVLEPWMPLWGSGELIVRAAGVEGAASVSDAVVSSLVATALLMAAGVLLWIRRIRIQPATTLADRPAVPATAAPDRRTS